jgi:hypothetical protein
VVGTHPNGFSSPRHFRSPWEWSRCQVRSRLSVDVVFCEARIRVYRHRFDFVGIHGAGPPCSREADGEVCGVALCLQHRREVTSLGEYGEELSPRAEEVFRSWGVEPRGPFVREA